MTEHCQLCGRPMTTNDSTADDWNTGGDCLACVTKIENDIANRKKPHHHPEHSGGSEYFEWHEHQHHHYHPNATTQSALQACLAALRSLASNHDREGVLSLVLSQLAHENHLDGLSRTIQMTHDRMNHYAAVIE